VDEENLERKDPGEILPEDSSGDGPGDGSLAEGPWRKVDAPLRLFSGSDAAESPGEVSGPQGEPAVLEESAGVAGAGSEVGAEVGQETAEAAGAALIRLSPEELRQGIEALLFCTGEPITIRQLAELFEVSVHDARDAVEELRLEYLNSGRAFRVEDIAGGVQVLTLPKYEPWVRRHLLSQREGRLSPAAFETLAVIAYKQPIAKAVLEGIRGVQCGPILKTLMDRNLVKVVGREDSLGKPMLYGTTKRFLESFGISGLGALPQPDLELPKPAQAPVPGDH